MAVCKECGALNPDSSKFCSACGQPIVKLDSKAIRDAMSQLEAEFEQDALVSLDRSRLTYICDVCGKVNPIDAKQCVRCGKKRPRSEYINALTKIKHSKNLRGAVDEMKAMDERPVPQSQPLPEREPVAKEEPLAPPAPILPKEEVSAQNYQKQSESMQMYRFEEIPAGPQQNRQIVQPFVIVPYVSQNQPLLQYDPNQIYRYEGYSEREKQMKAELDARIRAEQSAREEETQRALKEKQKTQIVEQLSRKQKEQKVKSKSQKQGSARVSVFAFLTLMVAVAVAVVSFIDLIAKDLVMFRYSAELSIIDMVKGLGTADVSSTIGILNLVFVILVLVFLVMTVLIALQSLARMFRGRVKRRRINLVLPLLALVVAAGIAVVKAYLVNFNAEALFVQPFGWIVLAGAAIVWFVTYLIMGIKKKRVR